MCSIANWPRGSPPKKTNTLSGYRVINSAAKRKGEEFWADVTHRFLGGFGYVFLSDLELSNRFFSIF